MTSNRKTTARQVEDGGFDGEVNRIKPGGLLAAQGEFAMEYFAAHAAVSSPESVTKRL